MQFHFSGARPASVAGCRQNRNATEAGRAPLCYFELTPALRSGTPGS